MHIATVAATSPEQPRHSEGDVIELADGRLLLVYMAFSGTGSDQAPTQIVAVESSDGGVTWSNRRMLVATQPGEMNVYSPNLIRAADGGVLFVFMRQHGAKPDEPGVMRSTHRVWKSSDEGRTFRPLATFMERREFGSCNAVIQRLSSGRLLLPVRAIEKGPGGGVALARCGAVLYSDDDGVTWHEASHRLYLPMRGVMEPHVAEGSDGRVLMVMRTQLGSVFMSESLDQGVSWSKPQTTGLRAPESCPQLARLPDGKGLVLIWNASEYDPGFASHFGKRSPLSAAVTRDNGRTWSRPRDIESDPARAFSNPGCRFTRDGRAVVNYWTCLYTPQWRMQNQIDLRVAVLEPGWFER